jgi:hypothetical protein
MKITRSYSNISTAAGENAKILKNNMGKWAGHKLQVSLISCRHILGYQNRTNGLERPN